LERLSDSSAHAGWSERTVSDIPWRGTDTDEGIWVFIRRVLESEQVAGINNLDSMRKSPYAPGETYDQNEIVG
jgi:hypothetical protein